MTGTTFLKKQDEASHATTKPGYFCLETLTDFVSEDYFGLDLSFHEAASQQTDFEES